MRRFSLLLLAAVTVFCLAGLGGAASTTAKLRIRPLLVARGSAITITGSGFRPALNVTLTIKQPMGTHSSRLATVRAKRTGGFRVSKVIARSTLAGLYVLTACQSRCRTKATARFRVAKIKPVAPGH
jgi:hypothetical protein